MTAIFSGAKLRYESSALKPLGNFQYGLGRGKRDSVLRVHRIYGDGIGPALQFEAKSFEREASIILESHYGFPPEKGLIKVERRLEVAGREM